MSKYKVQLSDKKITVGCAIICILTVLLCSLFENEYQSIIGGIEKEYQLLIGGMIFFVAGFFAAVANDTNYFGLIFLFSHGGAGLYVMVGNVIESIQDNPILSDPTFFMNLYLFTIKALFIIATLGTIAFNVSYKLREKRYLILILFSLFCLAIIMTYLFEPLFISSRI